MNFRLSMTPKEYIEYRKLLLQHIANNEIVIFDFNNVHKIFSENNFYLTDSLISDMTFHKFDINLGEYEYYFCCNQYNTNSYYEIDIESIKMIEMIIDIKMNKYRIEPIHYFFRMVSRVIIASNDSFKLKKLDRLNKKNYNNTDHIENLILSL
jgi:hypothetical protein